MCTTDCPLIAQEMRSADTILGAKASDTELVAIVANPTYTSTVYTKTFTEDENLSQVPNWLYLTGSLSQLSQVWQQYGVTVENLPAGAMSAHNDLAVVIDRNGHIRDEVGAVIGYGTRWTGSPPHDSYSRVSNSERFAPLQTIADGLIEHLRVAYHADIATLATSFMTRDTTKLVTRPGFVARAGGPSPLRSIPFRSDRSRARAA